MVDPFVVLLALALRPLRGAGYTFGSQVVRKFLALNKFDHMLRAHQLCMDGYSELFDKQLSTVWSAPNVSAVGPAATQAARDRTETDRCLSISPA